MQECLAASLSTRVLLGNRLRSVREGQGDTVGEWKEGWRERGREGERDRGIARDERKAGRKEGSREQRRGRARQNVGGKRKMDLVRRMKRR